jgi:hypothetical protein
MSPRPPNAITPKTCTKVKTQSLHEKRHETVTQNPLKCDVNESEIDEPNVAMAA